MTNKTIIIYFEHCVPIQSFDIFIHVIVFITLLGKVFICSNKKQEFTVTHVAPFTTTRPLAHSLRYSDTLSTNWNEGVKYKTRKKQLYAVPLEVSSFKSNRLRRAF